MNNLSREKITFNRAPLNFVVALEDPIDSPQRPHPIDLKELQRRAYERGLQKERESTTRLLEGLTAKMREQVNHLQQEREKDRRSIEGFAVRLALWVAEQVIFSAVDKDQYQVDELVRRALVDVKSDGVGLPAQIRLNPADFQLLKSGGHAPDEAVFVADPAVARAGLVLSAGDTSYWSLLSERLETVRSQVLARLEDSSAGA